MILITGATGTTGRDVVRRLTKAGVPVRAMTRDPDKARALDGFAGVELVRGDMTKTETLDAALSGVDKLLLTTAAALDWDDQHRNLIEAAKRQGVRYVVKLSAIGANLDGPSYMLSGHFRGEQAIEASGMAWTHLRPHVFMQNFVTFYAPTIKSNGAFYQCTGNRPLAQVDTRDVAEVAVRTLTEAGHEGKIYELTGPEALSYSEAAERIGKVVGRSITYIDMPGSVFAQGMIASGVPASIAEEAVNIYDKGYLEDGRGSRTTDTVFQITGHAPCTIEDFAQDYAQFLR